MAKSKRWIRLSRRASEDASIFALDATMSRQPTSGVPNNTALIFSELMDAKSLFLTNNADGWYLWRAIRPEEHGRHHVLVWGGDKMLIWADISGQQRGVGNRLCQSPSLCPTAKNDRCSAGPADTCSRCAQAKFDPAPG